MQPMWCKQQDGDWILELRLQPRASQDRIVGVENDRLKVRVTDPPIDNAANDKILRLMAKAFGVGRSQVQLLSGHTSRDKRVRISQPKRTPAWLQDG
ncbi:MAG: YggU family protein [Gammaproteobacteria bacterium]|nr:YggU family protein [Gammaproteobacteria bacterium]